MMLLLYNYILSTYPLCFGEVLKRNVASCNIHVGIKELTSFSLIESSRFCLVFRLSEEPSFVVLNQVTELGHSCHVFIMTAPDLILCCNAALWSMSLLAVKIQFLRGKI